MAHWADDLSEGHKEKLRAKYGAVPPWPFIRQRAAAELLGVSVESLQRLAKTQIPAVKTTGKSGGTVWLFKKEAVEQIASKLSSQRPQGF